MFVLCFFFTFCDTPVEGVLFVWCLQTLNNQFAANPNDTQKTVENFNFHGVIFDMLFTFFIKLVDFLIFLHDLDF